MTQMKDRLYSFLAEKNLKPSAFERQCNLSNGFCSKVKDKITDGSLMLIQQGFPELNTNWLKTGFGNMLNDTSDLENSKSDSDAMLAMVKMMGDFISISKQNAEANLINAEANRLNATNLDRLITIIERKFD